MREIEKRASSAPLDQGGRGPSNDVPVPAAVEPDEVITQKQVAKSTHVVIEASEEMSLEIARRLLKIEAQADELDIIRTNTLHRDVAYTSLSADERRLIDYMCRRLKLGEIERDGRRWRTTYEFLRRLFPDPKTKEQIRGLLDSLATNRFRIRNVKTGKDDSFLWLNRVTYEDGARITIEVTDRVLEYHQIPPREQIHAYGGYTHYYLTASLGLLLQHQAFFHHLLGRRVEWALKHHNSRVGNAPVAIEVTVDEMRALWKLAEGTKPYDLERYWLKDACERMTVATQLRITRYEALRAATRGKPIYAYRLYVSEVPKADFVERVSHLLELVRRGKRYQQPELPLTDRDERLARVTALKNRLKALGAYNSQLERLHELDAGSLSWAEAQVALWPVVSDAVCRHYAGTGPGRKKPIALLWHCLKEGIALEREYPNAFRELERRKLKAKPDKTPEPSQQQWDDAQSLAGQLAAWFTSLEKPDQDQFLQRVEQALAAPFADGQGTVGQAIIKRGLTAVFRQGKGSPYLSQFAELAKDHGFVPPPP